MPNKRATSAVCLTQMRLSLFEVRCEKHPLYAFFEKTQRSERVLGVQESGLRSLLSVNEEARLSQHNDEIAAYMLFYQFRIFLKS